MEFSSVLDECLNRVSAGESVESCLTSYPQLAAELAPMLAAVQDLRVLGAVRLSQGQRLRAKVALRQALAGHRQPWRPPLWTRLGVAPTAALVAVTLFLGVAITAVSASQPGDWGYRVRVVVERAPVWVQFSPQGRASTELVIAERRLRDVSVAGEQSGEVPPAALNALVQGVEAAASRAARLPQEGREAVAGRIEEHAADLLRLAGAVGDEEGATALRAAAERISAEAGKLKPPPLEEIPLSVLTPVPSATATPSSTPAAPQATDTRERPPTTTPAPVPPTRTSLPASPAVRARATQTVTRAPVFVPPAATAVPPMVIPPTAEAPTAPPPPPAEVVPTVPAPTVIVPTPEPEATATPKDWSTPPGPPTGPPPGFRPTPGMPVFPVPPITAPPVTPGGELLKRVTPAPEVIGTGRANHHLREGRRRPYHKVLTPVRPSP